MAARERDDELRQPRDPLGLEQLMPPLPPVRPSNFLITIGVATANPKEREIGPRQPERRQPERGLRPLRSAPRSGSSRCP